MKTKQLLVILLFAQCAWSLKAQTTLTTAVDFTETDIHGNSYNLFSILNAGQYVCIDFYATWCIPCQNTAPYFKQSYQNYGCNTAQVVFMSVSEGQPADNNAAVFAFDSTYLGGDPGYPSFSSVEGNGSQITVAYNIQALPSYILIAPNHTIVEQQMFPIASAASFDSYFSTHGLSYATCATGINDVEVDGQNLISVYPNPFSKETNLLARKILKESTLTVYNSLGQQVKQIKNISGQTITLGRDNLPCGLYFLCVTQNNEVVATNKLLIND